MGILRHIIQWVAQHKPDSLSRGSPHVGNRRRVRAWRQRFAGTLVPALCCLLAFAQVAHADTSKTGFGTVQSNGIYTVIAEDEAGNKTFRTVTIDNIIPKQTVDDEGNIVPDDGQPDTDYGEDIVATLVSDHIVNSNGTYSVMVLDQAGNISFQTVKVRNIEASGNAPGQDEDGNIIPDDTLPDEDYTEDIIDSMTDKVAVDSNGLFTAFVTDQAGNLTKRTYTVTNIKETATDPDNPEGPPEVKPDPDIPDTDEDYTEDILESMEKNSTTISNGKYSVAVRDEAGNLTIVDIQVDNIKEPDPEEPEYPDQPPGPPEDIKPDPGVPDTDEDYTEDIISELVDSKLVTESGIYAAIVRDQAGNYGIVEGEVNITGGEGPDKPNIDDIKPDTPGGEIPSPDGNTMTDVVEVLENGFYSASGEDNVGNIGIGTVLVRNIGAPDVKIIENPHTLVRKTDSTTGESYAEATITFTVTVPDGALLDYVKAVDADDNEIPLVLKNGLYTLTVNRNGIYHIMAADVTGRDGEYPIFVDYIFELETPAVLESFEGEDVELNANVTGGYPETYQWYSCDATGGNAHPIKAATAPIHTLRATYDLNNSYYFCVAQKGAYAVTSKPIQLVVYFAPVLQSKGYVIAAEDTDVTTDSTFKVSVNSYLDIMGWKE